MWTSPVFIYMVHDNDAQRISGIVTYSMQVGTSDQIPLTIRRGNIRSC